MISSAELALLGALLGATADTSVLQPMLDVRTKAAIGAAWHVPADRLRLDWGAMPELGVGLIADVRIVSEGRDGWMVIRIDRVGLPPLAHRLRAGRVDSAAVAVRELPAGSSVGADDARLEVRVLWGAPEAAVPVLPVGWEVKRRVLAGAVLEPPAVVAPRLVKTGDPVRLSWAGRTMALHVDGTALTDGRLGGEVVARVNGNRVTAVVTGQGTARLSERNPK